ncbi:HEAT/U-box domain-containing protein isoform X2 [Wolffia australiana]
MQVKALTTLCILFKEVPQSELALVVPKWVFEYKKLLYDYSRDVRRMTHEVMINLATAVRRGLAPHLKSLMGPWWFSQFDPVPEVAQAARRSLEAVFSSQEKRLDALVLCASEVFLYLDENLRIKPQEMMEKSIPPDELEEMYNHVISSSLLAIATLLDVLIGTKLQTDASDKAKETQKAPLKATENIKSSAERIFSAHHCFLDFFKSKSPRVRSATYSALGSYVKHMPQAFSEENMKTLSVAMLSVFSEKDPLCHSSMWDMLLLFSKKFPDHFYHANFHKTFLPRFWNFLQNGCYGSQGVSYPLLILLLDSMPHNVVEGESFLLKFLQNLWTGRNPYSSSLELAVFFKTFSECFLWGLWNSSRFMTREDDVSNLQLKLIVKILVGILWHGYLLPVTKDQEQTLYAKSNSLVLDEPLVFHERLSKGSSVNYPLSYFQELAKCIIVILSRVHQWEVSLLQAFCMTFHKDCLYTLQQLENGQICSVLAQRITDFLLVLHELVIQENQAWPLSHIAGPLFADVFPLLRSLDSLGAVNVLQTLVKIFGPRTIVSHIFTSSTRGGRESFDEGDDKKVTDFFLKWFEDDALPLCLEKYARSGGSRVELLISLLDGDVFFEQWSLIMAYAENMKKSPENGHVRVLALLLGKVREILHDKTPNMKGPIFASTNECWKHDFLESVAASVSRQDASLPEFHVSFLCAALGGSLEFDQTCFLSEETLLLVFEEILRKLVGLLLTSPFNWEKSAGSLLLSHGSLHSVHEVEASSESSLEMAQSAFDIINGSVFCLKRLDVENPELIASILAVIWIIEWETTITLRELANEKSDGFIDFTEDREYNNDDASLDHVNARLGLGKKMKDFHARIRSTFLRGLSAPCRGKVEDILVLTIKAAISDVKTWTFAGMSSFCCEWVMEILQDICQDDLEDQVFFTKLLSGSKSWAFWVSPGISDSGSSTINFECPHRTQEMEQIHQSFSSFIFKLILNLGVGKVIGGRPSTPPSLCTEDPDEKSVAHLSSRSWLAAELLCSWKWREGSAAGSILPLLADFAKTELSAEESIACCVAKILIDGAVLHATSGLPSFLNAWMLSDDEVESILNSYLRALVALLQTFIVKTNTWTKKEAHLLVEYAIGKLYVGGEVDLQCLRILPFILNVVIQPLHGSELSFDESKVLSTLDSVAEERLRRYASNWLEKALSLPLLALGQAACNDSAEWVQLVISCHPLFIIREHTSIQVKASQELDHLQRESLLYLFRRQRLVYEDSSSMKANTTLANLMAVALGYCWHDFDDDDWVFVFCQLKSFTNSTVLVMEEVAERVDAIILNAETGEGSDILGKRIVEAVQVINPLPVNITRIALVLFTLISQLEKNKEIETAETLCPTWPKTWAPIRNNIYDHALRLFFATGTTEAIAGSIGSDRSYVIASSRLAYSHFWELVSFCVINSPYHARKSGSQSMELWGLSKGPISALYAILFSSAPLSSLQLAAFHLLCSEPLSQLSVLKESCLLDASTNSENVLDSSSDGSSCLRDEISCIIGNPAGEVLKMDLTSLPRVNIFLCWGVLLLYLQSLPLSSSLREKLVMCIQDSVSPVVLDLVFQQFPLKGGSVHGLKKKDMELAIETKKAADAAKYTLTSCSLLFSVEKLWPISMETMAVFSGSIYAMMIRLLPAYVRNWFTALRDRSLSQSIESFTKAWCSPPLFSEELSQIKGASLGDDNFSVTVNKSALEIIATYKKEESGMDLVIRLPSCYPLRPVDVDCTRSLGVSEVKQRKWLLSLTAFVCNQNGAIAEAIRIWKSNLEREFEGVEECPICYSIIHTTNHSLPRLACKTCKHKFHSACLYKWFSTSHKSTCPLCQTPF